MKFCVIGLGRFGYQVAKTLADNGSEVLGVDSNELIIDAIKDDITQAVCIRIDDENCLVSIGIHTMDVVVVAMGENFAQSILVTALLKKKLHIPNVITRAISSIHRDILTLIGADRVILPEQEIGRKLADDLSAAPYAHLTRLTPEFGISYNGVITKFIGKRMSDVPFMHKYGVQCIGRLTPETSIEVLESDYQLQANDILVYAGPVEKLAYLPPFVNENSRIS